MNTLTWQIEKAGADFEFTAPLKSLERHRADVTPISGLHHPMVLGKHHNCDKVWLTGADVPGDGGAFRNTVSADQLMAEVQGVATRFASLEMAIEGLSLAWSRDGIQIPAERNTQQIFNMLFGVEKESKETIRRRLSRRGSILDLVADDAQRVTGKLGSEDRNKLDEYLTAVRQVEVRTQRADSWLNIPKPKLDRDEAARLQPQADMTEVARILPPVLRPDGDGLPHRFDPRHHLHDLQRVERRRDSRHRHLADPPRPVASQRRSRAAAPPDGDRYVPRRAVQLLPRSAQGASGRRTAAARHHAGALGERHGVRPQPRQRQPADDARRRSALGYKHGKHVDFNLPKIGKYNVADANGHYRICSRPVDDDARLSNLLLTMLQRVDVRADQFQDSVGTDLGTRG